jgi:hypothetical protein
VEIHLVEITPALATALDLLTAALDERGSDIVQNLRRLTRDAAAAVPTYLGLSLIISRNDPGFTVTTLADAVVDDDIGSSLKLLLRSLDTGPRPAVALVLYAGTPGAFVDLAADLAWLRGRSRADVTLDQHLEVPRGTDGAARLRRSSEINQATGVLVGLGYTPQEAHQHLDARAADDETDTYSVARLILDELIPADFRRRSTSVRPAAP